MLKSLLDKLSELLGGGPQAAPPVYNLRKAATEARLRTLGIPVNPHLPMVEDNSDAVLREPDEIARRAMVLHTVVGAAHGGPRGEIVGWLQARGLWEDASPAEREFLESEAPPEQARLDATWRVEALWTLLWALGEIEELSLPTGICDVPRVEELMDRQMTDPERFFASARLRSVAEILDATDMTYRLHWATRQARLDGDDPPGGLEPGVVYERHYALNWLTCYGGQEWDEVSTDT